MSGLVQRGLVVREETAVSQGAVALWVVEIFWVVVIIQVEMFIWAWHSAYNAAQ